MRREDTVRSAATVLLTYAGTAFFTGVLTLYLVRQLGPVAFGVFSLAMSIASLAAILIDFGIGSSAGRFMAERIDDRTALAQIFATSLRLKLLTGTAVAVLLFALAGPIADAYDVPSLAWPIRALALSTLLQSLVMQLSSAFLAISRTRLNLRMVLVEGSAEFSASIALVALSGGATAAAFGRSIGYAFGAAVGLVLVVRLLGRQSLAVHRRGSGPGPSTETLGRYALWLWLAGSAYLVYVQIDTIIIGAILGSAAVGAFSAPLRLSVFIAYPSLAIGNAVTPRLARRSEGERVDGTPVQAALRWLLVLQFLVVPPLLVWAQPIVDLLLGDGYGDSVPVVRVMAAFIFLQGFAPMLSLTANFLGEARRRLPWAIATVIVNVIIDLALLRSVGVEAAAIGSSVAIGVYVAGHWLICRRLVDIDARPLLWTLARSLVAAECMTAVLLLVGQDDLAAWQWIAGLVAGGLAYGLVLVGLGEFTRGELRRARAMLRAGR